MRSAIKRNRIRNGIFRNIREISQNDKKDGFTQELCLVGVARLPISSAFNELLDLDFVDYGDHVTCLHSEDTLRALLSI